MFFCFVAERGTHVRETVTCLEGSRKGFGSRLGEIGVPDSIVRCNSPGGYFADLRRNQCMTGEGSKSVSDRIRLSKTRNVKDRIRAT